MFEAYLLFETILLKTVDRRRRRHLLVVHARREFLRLYPSLEYKK